MTRSADLPANRVTIEAGLSKFCHWRSKPNPLLSDLTVDDLFAGAGPLLDLERAWFTGSCAWMPIVQGRMFDNATDIDIWFFDKDQARAFTMHALDKLNRADQKQRTYYESLECNRFGGPKIARTPAGRGRPARSNADHKIMDVFWLPPNRTIGEVISTYESLHERVAISAAASPADLHLVTRLTYPWQHNKRDKAHREECYGCARDMKAELDRQFTYSGSS